MCCPCEIVPPRAPSPRQSVIGNDNLEATANMSLIPTWYPPSREHWELITFYWQFFPLVSCLPATCAPARLPADICATSSPRYNGSPTSTHKARRPSNRSTTYQANGHGSSWSVPASSRCYTACSPYLSKKGSKAYRGPTGRWSSATLSTTYTVPSCLPCG